MNIIIQTIKNRLLRNLFSDHRPYRNKLFIAVLITVLSTTGLLIRGEVRADEVTPQVVVGNLDPSFGNGGKVMTQIGQLSDATDLCIQADGKIVTAGYALSQDADNNFEFALARYNPDGSLNASFGFGGKVTTDFSGADDAAASLALQPNGYLVVAGYASTSQDAFAVARYFGDSPAPPRAARLPVIQSVTTQGKQLIVSGFKFDTGAATLVDGQKQKKTFNDEASSETRLIAMKAAKFITHGQTVTIRVRNLDNRLSDLFTFTRP